MGMPCSSACSAAFTIDDACIKCSGHPEDVLETAIPAATDILYEMTGRRFPGSCQLTVRPCPQGPRSDPWRDRSIGRSGYACGCGTACGCGLSSILLGAQPVTGIVSVKVDGVTLDSSLYRVDEYRYLVRLPNADGTTESWPSSQDLALASTEDDTFEVTFTYGLAFPPMLVLAAKELACELAKACCNDESCSLPPRMVSMSRQGVDQVFANLSDFLDDGKIGLTVCDLAIKTLNPHGLRRRGRIASPDIGPAARRVGT